MNQRGFTLIELLITIMIIGILAAIAIPAYIGQKRSAMRNEAYSNLQNLRLLEEQFFAENGCYYHDNSGACANATRTGTSQIQYVDESTKLIPFLSGFKPGGQTYFNYSLVTNNTGTGGGNASCFTASAVGTTGTNVANEVYIIDCNNSRNF